MLQLLNQLSYVVAALLVLGAVLAGLFLRGVTPLRVGMVLAVVAVLVMVPLVLRTGRAMTSAAEVEGLVGSGTPVLLLFYSDL